jgi:hypothetical protein
MASVPQTVEEAVRYAPNQVVLLPFVRCVRSCGSVRSESNHAPEHHEGLTRLRGCSRRLMSLDSIAS